MTAYIFKSPGTNFGVSGQLVINFKSHSPPIPCPTRRERSKLYSAGSRGVDPALAPPAHVAVYGILASMLLLVPLNNWNYSGMMGCRLRAVSCLCWLYLASDESRCYYAPKEERDQTWLECGRHLPMYLTAAVYWHDMSIRKQLVTRA